MYRSKSSPLGSWSAEKGWLHELDARVKLLALASLSLAAFLAHGMVPLLLELALALVLGLGSGMRPTQFLRALRPTLLVLLFSLAANGLQLSPALGVSVAGLWRALVAVLRVVVLVMLAAVVSSSTTAPELARAISSALAPLARLGLPVGDLSLTVSLSLTLLPVTVEEFDRIEMAQRARGVRLDEGGPGQRLRRWASVLIPLVVALFRRSEELARSMRDRCFRPGAPLSVPGPIAPRDVALALLALALSLLLSLL